MNAMNAADRDGEHIHAGLLDEPYRFLDARASDRPGGLGRHGQPADLPLSLGFIAFDVTDLRFQRDVKGPGDFGDLLCLRDVGFDRLVRGVEHDRATAISADGSHRKTMRKAYPASIGVLIHGAKLRLAKVVSKATSARSAVRWWKRSTPALPALWR